MTNPHQDLIYDWNAVGEEGTFRPAKRIEFDDETLRDGLQSPSVRDPDIAEKIRMLHLMDELGIDAADIGLPGAGPRAVADVLALAHEIVRGKLRIRPNCAARTLKVDIDPIVEVSQKAGIPIEASVFIGSSPIRQYAEDWTLDKMVKHSEDAVSHAVKNGLPVMYVTEDTTRALPDTLERLYATAIHAGARRICVCDTVGHATPSGVAALLAHVHAVVKKTREDVKVDWHGHRDRDLSIVNTLAAIRAGADRVHGTGIGVGERVGNTPMDLLLVNLKLLGWIDNDLRKLGEYCEAISKATGVPIPRNYPVFGEDAFETATGVHAAAVIKAYRKGDVWLADRVYCGVPAGEFGREQKIRVGPMSGKSNVVFWLERRGYPADEDLVQEIFDRAKHSDRLLADDEIIEIVRSRRTAAAKIS
ncbi:MAG: 2-isopropylmalate synthase [Planctomycetes bacterium]|nr:2-isopropylmalate synthase [Planctomycetota bacterium]